MRLPDLALAASIGGIACMGAAASARAQTYQQLYSFSGAPGDNDSVAGLTSLNGMLFGTTATGGATGSGTVFAFDPQTGVEKSIYAFQGDADGFYPKCKLISYGGLLYGTTASGGAGGDGTVFSLDPRTHVETVLHAFQGSEDGAFPLSGLLNVAGTLYGTTFSGGSQGRGTTFSVNSATGAEAVVYSFYQGQSDASSPNGSLIVVDGLLYGTTGYGGENDDGTVFSINPANGAETVLASFKRPKTGFYPEGALIKVGGKLYGTAASGGEKKSGTVFSFELSTGAFKTVYSFQGGSDGAGPNGGLVSLHGTLYGTTISGGGVSCGRYTCGTVFSVNIATKAEKVVYAFKGGKDGSAPQTSLTAVRGALYGTTTKGGAANAGTIFKIVP